MSVPRPVLELMELIDDIAQGKSVLRTGPVRLEAPLDLLVESPLGTPLEELVARAWFLAPICKATPTASEWRGLAALAQSSPELHFDLSFPDPPIVDDIPEILRPRIARARIQVGGVDAGAVVRATEPLAGWIAGRVTLELIVPPGSVTSLEPLLQVIAAATVPRDVVLRSTDRRAREELHADWPGIARAATDLRLNIQIRGGERIDAGIPLDSMAGPHVLDTCIRAAFRTRASLCPFPFLGLRIRDNGEVAVCPASNGPSTSDPLDGNTWNGRLFASVREGFLTGSPPVACDGCTVLPTVRRSLAVTPWDDPALPSADLPAGAVDV